MYPNNGMFLGNKKKWDTDTCYKNGWNLKCYTKWYKLVTKHHKLYESVHMKCPG